MRRKRKNDMIGDFGNAAVDLGMIGLATGIGSAAANRFAPDSGLGGTIGTVGSIAGTAYLGGFAIKQLKKMKRMY